MQDYRTPLIWAGLVLAALFVIAVFLGVTKFRSQLLADDPYLKDRQRQSKVFQDFSPEALDTPRKPDPVWQQTEQEREEAYKRNEGIPNPYVAPIIGRRPSRRCRDSALATWTRSSIFRQSGECGVHVGTSL